jgi:hypothetical protein
LPIEWELCGNYFGNGRYAFRLSGGEPEESECLSAPTGLVELLLQNRVLGFRFAPRIRDLKEKRLYLLPGMIVPPELAAQVAGAVNLHGRRSLI